MADLAEALATIAEVAIGLAGFSGIVVVLSRTYQRRLTPLERYRLVILLVPSLASTFLALVTLALVSGRVPGAFRIGSALLAAFCLWFPASRVRKTLDFHRRIPELFHLGVVWGLLAGYLIVGVVSLMHALNVFGEEPAVLLLGLLWPLFQSAVQFARMLFIRPADPDADD